MGTGQLGPSGRLVVPVVITGRSREYGFVTDQPLFLVGRIVQEMELK